MKPAGPPLFFICNGLIKHLDSFVAASDQSTVLYEVIRITEGVCLFLEDHLNRLTQSAKLAGLKIPLDNEILKTQLYHLAEINQRTIGNVRLDIVYEGQAVNVRIYFVPHHYPSIIAYKKGINTITLQAGRENPNAKIIRDAFRKKTEELITRHKVWEVLLCNKQGEITEGSKSNVFIVHQNRVLTPPGKVVLKGITRGYIFNICNKLNIPISEEKISFEILPAVQAFFITGTSPKILPVKRIDKQLLAIDNPIMRRLMEAYDYEIACYIHDHRTN
jgi:branched-chain amino acid aminotransferase